MSLALGLNTPLHPLEQMTAERCHKIKIPHEITNALSLTVLSVARFDQDVLGNKLGGSTGADFFKRSKGACSC